MNKQYFPRARKGNLIARTSGESYSFVFSKVKINREVALKSASALPCLYLDYQVWLPFCTEIKR